MIAQLQKIRSTHQYRKRLPYLGFERLMALMALLNLGLVLFDLSYIPGRDLYLKYLPNLTLWYGEQVKGIEPHRDTVAYLNAVNDLESQVAQTGLQSPEVSQQLATLQGLSVNLVDENPFEAVGKSGTLERLKRRMREEVGDDSAKQAFQTFWSQDYLSRQGWQPSIQFFRQQIEPLMATNYYRRIGENGLPINRFWRIDIWFMALFAAEFLARTQYLSRSKGVSWMDAVIWRCYDIPLLLPFWRWLRIIPVMIRLDQAQLVNLQPLYHRLVRNVIGGVAIELTEMVVIRIINQTQGLVRDGAVRRWLADPNRYIDLNGINEAEVITKHLIDLVVYRALPKLQPEVEALMHHSLTQVLNRSPLYAGLQQLPGMSHAADQLTQQLVADLSSNTYATIRAALEDETGAVLMQQLIHRVGEVYREELKQNPAFEDIQQLTITLLEEIKLNYIQQVEVADQAKLPAPNLPLNPPQ